MFLLEKGLTPQAKTTHFQTFPLSQPGAEPVRMGCVPWSTCQNHCRIIGLSMIFILGYVSVDPQIESCRVSNYIWYNSCRYKQKLYVIVEYHCMICLQRGPVPIITHLIPAPNLHPSADFDRFARVTLADWFLTRFSRPARWDSAMHDHCWVYMSLLHQQLYGQ